MRAGDLVRLRRNTIVPDPREHERVLIFLGLVESGNIWFYDGKFLDPTLGVVVCNPHMFEVI